ncbi:DNA polymerase III subunit gamma and tau [Actinotalea solisilvae]|uniref:DNA polymerase III subunit gamma and tau n=1 Tax=Actinotalea solisilvae TaxID=2072922 RepID=UPI0018F1D13E|nr:DNA polymerase III subunit gamma and tau [Actinotalea solisilvae]
MSTALYRRYRPDTFTEVIGQEHVTEPLMQALKADKVTHAYLFSGPRGCGKTTSARILARCLNCAEGPTPNPCGRCESCRELGRGGPGSLDVVEIDAASHGGVDDARDLRERATFAPARDRFKIFILDEAHMVTSQGFNALLKIVEEPPPHIKFIFATTEPDKVIGTIRSRTHHYPFRLVGPATLQPYLQELCDTEGVTVGSGVLPLVVRAGGGSVRDSLSVLDQLVAGADEGGIDYERAVALLGYTHAALLDDVVDAVAARDGASAFRVVERVIASGHEPRRFVEDLLERLRDLIVIAAAGESAQAVLRDLPADQLERMRSQASVLGPAELSRSADLVNAALTEMTGATSPRLHLELLVARLLLPAADDGALGLGARLDRVERQVASGVPAGAVHAAPGAVVGSVTPAPAVRTAPAAPAAPVATSVPPEVPAAPTTPAAPTPPSQPGAPAEPVPSEPAAPGPSGPSVPSRPSAPTVPSTPSEPVVPARPSEPVVPAVPSEPSRPVDPTEPDEPDVPDEPDETVPAGPDGPVPAEPGAAAPDERRPSEPSEPDVPATSEPSAADAGGGAVPPAAPAAPAAVAAPGVDAETVRRRWPEVLQTLRGLRMATWVLVSQNAQVGEVTADRLALAFTTPQLATTFRSGPHPENVQRALHETLGLTVRVETTLAESASAAPTAAGPAAAAEPAPSAAPSRISTAAAEASWDSPAATPPPAERDAPRGRTGDAGPPHGARAAGAPAASQGTARESAGRPGARPDGRPAGTPASDGVPDGPEPDPEPEPPLPSGGGRRPPLRVPEGAGPRVQQDRQAPRRRPEDDGADASPDDPDLLSTGLVGAPLVAQMLGGSVIDEILEDPR